MRIIARPAFRERTGNPYNWLLYTHIAELGHHVEEYSPAAIIKGGFDVWHLHWPEFFLNERNILLVWRRLATTFGLLTAARARGTRVIWTVHNLQAHEALHPALERRFWDRFTALVDGYIYLSEAGKEQILSRFPRLENLPGFFIPHGHYRGIYPDRISREEARAKLGLSLSQPVIACFGNIRPYKGIPHLIRTFRKIAGDGKILLVAGRSEWEELSNEIRSEAAPEPGVRLTLGHIPEEDVQLYLRAADLVVLPFREIFNSGSALLALSFDRPILVPKKGSLSELRKRVGDAWVRTYSGELTPDSLSDALEWSLQRTRPARPDLEAYNWAQIAASTVEAYRIVCSGRERREAPAPGGG